MPQPRKTASATTTTTRTAFLATLLLAVPLLALGCGGSGGGPDLDGGSAAALRFHGEEAAFPGFSHDTGFLPADQPMAMNLARRWASSSLGPSEPQPSSSSMIAPFRAPTAASGSR